MADRKSTKRSFSRNCRSFAGFVRYMAPTNTRNLTRYTYEKTAFQGWRLSINRQQLNFTRYFSDKAFGGEETSLAAAVQLRDTILAELRATPEEVEEVFNRYR